MTFYIALPAAAWGDDCPAGVVDSDEYDERQHGPEESEDSKRSRWWTEMTKGE